MPAGALLPILVEPLDHAHRHVALVLGKESPFPASTKRRPRTAAGPPVPEPTPMRIPMKCIGGVPSPPATMYFLTDVRSRCRKSLWRGCVRGVIGAFVG